MVILHMLILYILQWGAFKTSIFFSLNIFPVQIHTWNVDLTLVLTQNCLQCTSCMKQIWWSWCSLIFRNSRRTKGIGCFQNFMWIATLEICSRKKNWCVWHSFPQLYAFYYVSGLCVCSGFTWLQDKFLLGNIKLKGESLAIQFHKVKPTPQWQ